MLTMKTLRRNSELFNFDRSRRNNPMISNKTRTVSSGEASKTSLFSLRLLQEAIRNKFRDFNNRKRMEAFSQQTNLDQG